MRITEKMAKEMRCCGPLPCGVNDPQRPPERKCIGIKCMAWRFDPPHDQQIDRPPTGFCGLAGQPST